LGFFHLKNKYYQYQKTQTPPESLVQTIEDLKDKINEHYIRHYHSFYDILFISKHGDIFYTVRKQEDYHKNIFQGDLSKTALAQQLKRHPNETFVDYQYYTVSDEPSAFIVEPVLKEGVFEGWLALQCAINKINNMFTQDKGLGVTGEVFLVNKQNYMLTDSRFFGESSILKRDLSRENIESKFRERSGHKIVTDYRGFRALTSFDVCRISNSEWLLIAKIDENEIITEQYKKNRETLAKSIVQSLVNENPRDCGIITPDSKLNVVDMDEFRKVTDGEICTYGVSTCTAVIISYPGKFSYMGHISSLDRIYGGETTDLISHIFKQIKTFDIYKYELRKLRATIIANHIETVMSTIDKLAEVGAFSFTNKIYDTNHKAQYANVLHDYSNNRTFVEWLMDRNTGKKLRQCSLDVKTMGELVKALIGYEN